MKHLKAITLATLALVPAGTLAACGSSATTGTASSSSADTTASQTRGTTPGGQQGEAPPGMGTEVTGTAATKAGDAATAKYDGTAERVMQLDDGSYAVMVTSADADTGMQVVLVSADFEVTGLQERPSGSPPSGQGQGGTAPTTPPSGDAPAADAAAS